jgi:hypothetical protein
MLQNSSLFSAAAAENKLWGVQAEQLKQLEDAIARAIYQENFLMFIKEYMRQEKD